MLAISLPVSPFYNSCIQIGYVQMQQALESKEEDVKRDSQVVCWNF